MNIFSLEGIDFDNALDTIIEELLLNEDKRKEFFAELNDGNIKNG